MPTPLTFKEWKERQTDLNIEICVFCDYEGDNEDCEICDGHLYVLLDKKGNYLKPLYSLYDEALKKDKTNWNRLFHKPAPTITERLIA